MKIKNIFAASVLLSSCASLQIVYAQQSQQSFDNHTALSKSEKDNSQAVMSEAEYLKKRAALIIKHSYNDTTFGAMQKAMETEDGLSAEFWRWKIDQYLYGQYPEFQPIYNAYKHGRSFIDIYGMDGKQLIGKAESPAKPPRLPEGYFSENLPKNRSPGDSHYRDGKIYIAYEGKLTDPYITSYDTKTNKWAGPYKAGHNTLSKNGRKADGHGEPTMQQADDGHFHITFGGHGGESEDGLNPLSIDTPHAGGRFIHVVSDKPNDISSFSPQDDVSPFASYAQSVKMPNGDMYFFTRAGTHKSPWVYYKLKQGNKRFEPPVMITWPTPRKDNPIMVDMFYIKTFKANDTDILVTMMNHLCNFKEVHTSKHDDRFNAYYLRLDTTTDTFYNVKDEVLTLPITKASGDQHALVYDSIKDGTIVNDTLGLTLQNGKPAMSYEIRHPEPRHWHMATFENGSWKTDQPMPGTTVWKLQDGNGKPVRTINNLVTLNSNSKNAKAAVIYRNANKETVFAIAERNESHAASEQIWKVKSDHLLVKGAGMQMEAVRDETGDAIGVVINVSKGKARRLYLWHDGQIRPRQ